MGIFGEERATRCASSSSLGDSLGVRGPTREGALVDGTSGRQGRVRGFRSTSGDPGSALWRRGVVTACGGALFVPPEDSAEAVLKPRRRRYSERDIRTFSCLVFFGVSTAPSSSPGASSSDCRFFGGSF